MTSSNGSGDDGTVAAVLRLADLAAKVERTDARIDQLARDCTAAIDQIAGLRGTLGTLAGRADQIENRLADVSSLLSRMSAQITALTEQPADPDTSQGYKVNSAPPWWKPADPRCAETTARLADWVTEVYRPVYGYLAGLLAPCWRRHPLCLAYLDAIHEAWCLLYLGQRDPNMVFAQLDWLTRSLLQATEVMANDTKRCRDVGQHSDPGEPPAQHAPWLNARR
jgi:hypothetical protein